ncbi:hypothetical protein PFISCL1PPCAC_27874, partial [Pristionchus fissidentatus]
NQSPRIEVSDSTFCSSSLGRIGGVQQLNLAEACMKVGTITHEIAHSLGILHTQSRHDRDQYVEIEWGNINHTMLHNFNKEDVSRAEVHDIPYEFGSVMHYSEKDFVLDNSKSSLRAKFPHEIYQKSMLGRMPTFFDVIQMNKHLNCFANCPSSIDCLNGGVQDVNACDRCKCPMGWTGDKCNQRPSDTVVINASEADQVFKHRAGNRNGGASLFYNQTFYLFKAPPGRRVQFTPKVLGTQWTNSCESMGIEVQVKTDPRFAGVQICDWRETYAPIISSTDELVVMAYTRGGLSAIDFIY